MLRISPRLRSTVSCQLSGDYSIVIRDDGGLYQMGPRSFSGRTPIRRRPGLCEIARPWLRALWEALETVHLFIRGERPTTR